MRYLLMLLLPFLAAGQGSEVYYPEPGEAWKKRTPEPGRQSRREHL